MKNLSYDNANARCVPYDSPPLGLAAQLQRLATEERPGACLGCGFEHNCCRTNLMMRMTATTNMKISGGHARRR